MPILPVEQVGKIDPTHCQISFFSQHLKGAYCQTGMFPRICVISEVHIDIRQGAIYPAPDRSVLLVQLACTQVSLQGFFVLAAEMQHSGEAALCRPFQDPARSSSLFGKPAGCFQGCGKGGASQTLNFLVASSG